MINVKLAVLILAVIIGLYFVIAGAVWLVSFLAAAAFSWMYVNYIWMGVITTVSVGYIIYNKGLE